MIPISFCSFPSFIGVFFRLNVELVLDFILNTSHFNDVFALKFRWLVLTKHRVHLSQSGILSELSHY